MEILFNNGGDPLIMKGTKVFASTVTVPKSVKEKVDDTFQYRKVEYASWGDSNCYPDEADKIIRSTSVLQTGLNYKCRCCYGQGVVPVQVSGFDENYNEIVTPVTDETVLRYLRGLPFRNYHTAAFRDLAKFGNCFPLLVFDNVGRIARVQMLNARHCRISLDKTKLLVFGDFQNGSPTDNDTVVYPMLDEEDPAFDLNWRRDTGRLDNVSAIAFPRIKNYFSSSDYYAAPDWKSAQESGWIDIAHKIPTFLNRAYENAMFLMWHVQVPATYWEKQFPKTEYNSVAERREAIQNFMDDFEKQLTSFENANKALWTQYFMTDNGQTYGDWKISRMDSEIKATDKLSTSAAANSEILFSLMVNPSVLGAGMPGGPYAGNAGSGSDIREGLLVSMILSHIEKQAVLDPVELMLEFNGYSNIDLKYRNITLATLDSGKSTQEQLT